MPDLTEGEIFLMKAHRRWEGEEKPQVPESFFDRISIEKILISPVKEWRNGKKKRRFEKPPFTLGVARSAFRTDVIENFGVFVAIRLFGS